MSSIASAMILPLGSLNTIGEAAVPTKSFFGKQKDGFPAFLEEHGLGKFEFNGSGHIVASVIAFLAIQGLPLKSEYQAIELLVSNVRGSSFFILTHKMRETHLDQIRSNSYTDDQLRGFFELLYSTDAPGVERAMRDGLQFLSLVLESISPKHVALLALA